MGELIRKLARLLLGTAETGESRAGETARRGLKGQISPLPTPVVPDADPASIPDWFLEGLEEEEPNVLLERRNILLNCPSVSPEEAIRACGRQMVKTGYVEEPYIQGMLEREKEFSLAIGNHVAIPHGVNAVRRYIRRNGLVVMTYPDGIPWDGDVVRLVVGIAADSGGEHLDILGRVVNIVATEADTDRLVEEADAEDLYARFNDMD